MESTSVGSGIKAKAAREEEFPLSLIQMGTRAQRATDPDHILATDILFPECCGLAFRERMPLVSFASIVPDQAGEAGTPRKMSQFCHSMVASRPLGYYPGCDSFVGPDIADPVLETRVAFMRRWRNDGKSALDIFVTVLDPLSSIRARVVAVLGVRSTLSAKPNFLPCVPVRTLSSHAISARYLLCKSNLAPLWCDNSSCNPDACLHFLLTSSRATAGLELDIRNSETSDPDDRAIIFNAIAGRSPDTNYYYYYYYYD